jgi:hypothetical protein
MRRPRTTRAHTSLTLRGASASVSQRQGTEEYPNADCEHGHAAPNRRSIATGQGHCSDKQTGETRAHTRVAHVLERSSLSAPLPTRSDGDPGIYYTPLRARHEKQRPIGDVLRFGFSF